MSWLKPLAEAAKEIGFDVVVVNIFNWLKERSGPVVAKRLGELTVESRAAVWAFITNDLAKSGNDGKRAAEALLRMQTLRANCSARPYGPIGTLGPGVQYLHGEENVLNYALAKFYAVFELQPLEIKPKERWEHPNDYRLRVEAEREVAKAWITNRETTRKEFFERLGLMAGEKPGEFDAVIDAVNDDSFQQLILRILFLLKDAGEAGLDKLVPLASAIDETAAGAADSVRSFRENLFGRWWLRWLL